MLNNGCNDFLFGVHCVEEGDRIPPLQSYGQALKQKDCFSGVLSDGYYYYYYYLIVISWCIVDYQVQFSSRWCSTQLL